MKDPPATDKCAQCGKPVKALKIHGKWETDPFCTAVCCRGWHQVGQGVVTAVSGTGKPPS